MFNMVKYQHSYAACARVINAMDEMLDLIVNRLGIVGRECRGWGCRLYGLAEASDNQ